MSELDKQEQEILLNLGMATKQSAELQDPSTMRVVRNLHWRGAGEIERKPANEVAYTADAVPAGAQYAVTQACGLVVRGKEPSEPILVTGSHGVMTYDVSTGDPEWAISNGTEGRIKYSPVNYGVSRRIVDRTQGEVEQYGVYKVASAQHFGVQVIAWITHGASAVLHMKAIDADTGRVVCPTRTVSLGTGMQQHITACEYTEPGKEGVVIAYAASTASPHDIHAYHYDYATRAFVAYPSIVTNVSTVGGGMRFTARRVNDRFMLGFRNNATGFLNVQDRTLTAVTSTHAATHGFTYGLDIVPGPTRTLIISTDQGDLNAYAEVFGSPNSRIIFATGVNVVGMTLTGALETRTVGGTHDAVVWMNVSTAIGGQPRSTFVTTYQLNFLNITPTTTARTSVIPHAWCVSNAFTLHGRAHAILALGLTSTNHIEVTARAPASCVVARYTGHSSGVARSDPVARICHDRFFLRADLIKIDLTTLDIFSATHVDAYDNVWIALTADPSAFPFDVTFMLTQSYYAQTIMLCKLDGKRPMPVPYASPEPGVVVAACGFPWQYDGDVPTEAGPITQPLVDLDLSNVGGPTGSFAVIGVWRWTDAAGRAHRVASAPVLTGALTNQRIDVYVSVCPLTAYTALNVSNMACEVYITNGANGIYQLAMKSNDTRMVRTDITTDGCWHRFTGVDPALGEGFTDAIFSSEVAPEPTPAFLHISKIADRMWAVDGEDRSRIWFSKPLVAGVGVEWSTICTLTVGDEATAVVDVGGMPTVLARAGIYQIAGPGPDALGYGSFSPAQKLPYEVDCLDPVSVCRTPLGVVFRGRRGLYVFGDGLNVSPGLIMDNEMLTSPSIDPSTVATYRLRVVYQEQTNEIHCLTPAGTRLVYNTVEQKWSEYTQSLTTADLAIARGKLWRVDRDFGGSDVLASEKMFSEVGATYNEEATGGWRIDTPWYRFDQVGGQARLWRVWLALKLAEDPAESTVSLSYYADWSDAAIQTVTWSGAELAALAADVVVKLPFMPRRQVSSAFKFSISASASGTATACPKPLALRLRVGTRPSKGKNLRSGVKG